MAETQWAENMARSLEKWGPKTDRALRMVAVPINSGDIWDALADMEALRLALAEAQHEAETLKTERNTALTLAEQRGSAYDMTWREVESLREWKDKEQEERGRQYGLRLQIADEFAFLRELLVAVVKTGTKDPLLDARITEELRSHE